MFSQDVDAELQRLVDDPRFEHRDAARRAVRYRATGDVADLVAIVDDPHPCATTETVFAMAGAQRPWLNWVPMPSEAISNLADEVGSRRAKGEHFGVQRLAMFEAEPASAVTAGRRVMGAVDIGVEAFPAPDIRLTLRRGRYAVWRYDGIEPVPSVPAPSAAAIGMLHEVAGQPWASVLSGHLAAAPLGELPLRDLLGLLGHPPEPPDTPRYQYMAQSAPTYWYRFLQPWVCLGILHHAEQEPWARSARREVLVDLAFGIEDWIADAALFALVADAYREPGRRKEVRTLVRARLDAAVAADRLVTIEESLAHLMLVTPGSRADDRAVAKAALARAARDDGREPVPFRKPRWWRRRG